MGSCFPQSSHFTTDKICGIIGPERTATVSVGLSTASDYGIDVSVISAFFDDLNIDPHGYRF